MKLVWSKTPQMENMPAFKGCQADGRFIDCEECRWAQFRIREWLDDRGECHDEEVIVCSKPKEAKAYDR